MISPSAISPLNRRVVEGFDALNLNWDVYYNADNVIESGGLVSQITDLSGNNNHATEANGAYQSELTTDASINNQHSLIVSNNDRYALSSVNLVSTNSWTFIFIGRTNSGSLRFGANIGINLITLETISVVRFYTGTNRDSSLLSPNSESYSIFYLVNNSGVISFYQNGINRGTANIIADADLNFNSLFFIGGSFGSLGRFSQLAAKTSAISTTDLNNLGAYYSNKYGIAYSNI